jgi:mono/diheme cytochrome c family protein
LKSTLGTTLPVAALLIALAAACYDPVHEDDVASLGNEVPGVPEGPLHRPGQHCTTCHGGDGPGDPQWSVAGTIFAYKGQTKPEVGATVTVTDKNGAQIVLTTNEAGNFYVEKDVWNPAYPLHVKISVPGITRSMDSSIGRDGGCAACHRGVGDRHYVQQVWMREDNQ